MKNTVAFFRLGFQTREELQESMTIDPGGPQYHNVMKSYLRRY